jgi:disulfide oxidoreductase YuzD
VSEIKDLSALEEYLSNQEYKKRYIEILNKEEFKQLQFISEIKDIMSLKV